MHNATITEPGGKVRRVTTQPPECENTVYTAFGTFVRNASGEGFHWIAFPEFKLMLDSERRRKGEDIFSRGRRV